MYKMNKFPIIEFHILQSFPVSCLNRDDTNSPKTCVIGGIERARVSSQCWKRSVRLSLRDFDIKLGIRTKKVAEGIEKSLKDKGCAEEAVIKSAQEVSKLIAEDSLTFFTDKEYEAIADLLLDKKSVKIGDISKVIKKGKIQVLNGLDIALFGRMVAKAPSVLPAYAGMFLGVSAFVFVRESSPRVCGDVSWAMYSASLISPFSPRMRGCFSIDDQPDRSLQVLPAYAGMFPSPGTE